VGRGKSAKHAKTTKKRQNTAKSGEKTTKSNKDGKNYEEFDYFLCKTKHVLRSAMSSGRMERSRMGQFTRLPGSGWLRPDEWREIRSSKLEIREKTNGCRMAVLSFL
jgi:hypothetical protein